MATFNFPLFNGVTHYPVDDIYEADCYFICEFEKPLDHSDGFSHAHRFTLPTVQSTYPNCVECLQAAIGELSEELQLWAPPKSI